MVILRDLRQRDAALAFNRYPQYAFELWRTWLVSQVTPLLPVNGATQRMLFPADDQDYPQG